MVLDEERICRKVKRFLKGKHPASSVLGKVAKGPWQTYLFGGTLREIAVKSRNRQFRDLDVVIDDSGFTQFRHEFFRQIHGVNSFGGLRLIVDNFKVDAWPLASTWAFKHGYVDDPSVERLPDTTFLNLDSIVMEITPGRIRRRRLHAKRFIEAFRHNVIDIVLSENPIPSLAAVRAIRMHLTYNVPLSRSLANFILLYLYDTTPKECVQQQIHHYGRVFMDESGIDRFMESIQHFIESDAESSLENSRQMAFLSEDGMLLLETNEVSKKALFQSRVFRRLDHEWRKAFCRFAEITGGSLHLLKSHALGHSPPWQYEERVQRFGCDEDNC